VLKEIGRFDAVDDDWLPLQTLLDALPDEVEAEEFQVLLGVFERFPEHDGYGIFWAILHRLEAASGYEGELVRSVRRAPNEFNLTMVHRILNAGQREAGGVTLLTLLRGVADDVAVPEELRGTAASFVGCHSEG